ncbi:MAG: GNAT family N-acetyltransferase [Bacteroidota bacterium]
MHISFDLDSTLIPHGQEFETELIGSTGLHTRIGDQAREIGYWTNINRINQGYATEAVRALVKVGFEIEQLDWLEIRCEPQNIRSQGIPKKLGFQLEATLKDRTTNVNGELRDVMIWSLYRAAYPKSALRKIKVRAFDVLGQSIQIIN